MNECYDDDKFLEREILPEIPVIPCDDVKPTITESFDLLVTKGPITFDETLRLPVIVVIRNNRQTATCSFPCKGSNVVDSREINSREEISAEMETVLSVRQQYDLSLKLVALEEGYNAGTLSEDVAKSYEAFTQGITTIEVLGELLKLGRVAADLLLTTIKARIAALDVVASEMASASLSCECPNEEYKCSCETETRINTETGEEVDAFVYIASGSYTADTVEAANLLALAACQNALNNNVFVCAYGNEPQEVECQTGMSGDIVYVPKNQFLSDVSVADANSAAIEYARNQLNCTFCNEEIAYECEPQPYTVEYVLPGTSEKIKIQGTIVPVGSTTLPACTFQESDKNVVDALTQAWVEAASENCLFYNDEIIVSCPAMLLELPCGMSVEALLQDNGASRAVVPQGSVVSGNAQETMEVAVAQAINNLVCTYCNPEIDATCLIDPASGTVIDKATPVDAAAASFLAFPEWLRTGNSTIGLKEGTVCDTDKDTLLSSILSISKTTIESIACEPTCIVTNPEVKIKIKCDIVCPPCTMGYGSPEEIEMVIPRFMVEEHSRKIPNGVSVRKYFQEMFMDMYGFLLEDMCAKECLWPNDGFYLPKIEIAGCRNKGKAPVYQIPNCYPEIYPDDVVSDDCTRGGAYLTITPKYNVYGKDKTKVYSDEEYIPSDPVPADDCEDAEYTNILEPREYEKDKFGTEEAIGEPIPDGSFGPVLVQGGSVLEYGGARKWAAWYSETPTLTRAFLEESVCDQSIKLGRTITEEDVENGWDINDLYNQCNWDYELSTFHYGPKNPVPLKNVSVVHYPKGGAMLARTTNGVNEWLNYTTSAWPEQGEATCEQSVSNDRIRDCSTFAKVAYNGLVWDSGYNTQHSEQWYPTYFEPLAEPESLSSEDYIVPPFTVWSTTKVQANKIAAQQVPALIEQQMASCSSCQTNVRVIATCSAAALQPPFISGESAWFGDVYHEGSNEPTVVIGSLDDLETAGKYVVVDSKMFRKCGKGSQKPPTWQATKMAWEMIKGSLSCGELPPFIHNQYCVSNKELEVPGTICISTTFRTPLCLKAQWELPANVLEEKNPLENNSCVTAHRVLGIGGVMAYNTSGTAIVLASGMNTPSRDRGKYRTGDSAYHNSIKVIHHHSTNGVNYFKGLVGGKNVGINEIVINHRDNNTQAVGRTLEIVAHTKLHVRSVEPVAGGPAVVSPYQQELIDARDTSIVEGYKLRGNWGTTVIRKHNALQISSQLKDTVPSSDNTYFGIVAHYNDYGDKTKYPEVGYSPVRVLKAGTNVSLSYETILDGQIQRGAIVINSTGGGGGGSTVNVHNITSPSGTGIGVLKEETNTTTVKGYTIAGEGRTRVYYYPEDTNPVKEIRVKTEIINSHLGAPSHSIYPLVSPTGDGITTVWALKGGDNIRLTKIAEAGADKGYIVIDAHGANKQVVNADNVPYELVKSSPMDNPAVIRGLRAGSNVTMAVHGDDNSIIINSTATSVDRHISIESYPNTFGDESIFVLDDTLRTTVIKNYSILGGYGLNTFRSREINRHFNGIYVHAVNLHPTEDLTLNPARYSQLPPYHPVVVSVHGPIHVYVPTTITDMKEDWEAVKSKPIEFRSVKPGVGIAMQVHPSNGIVNIENNGVTGVVAPYANIPPENGWTPVWPLFDDTRVVVSSAFLNNDDTKIVPGADLMSYTVETVGSDGDIETIAEVTGRYDTSNRLDRLTFKTKVASYTHGQLRGETAGTTYHIPMIYGHTTPTSDVTPASGVSAETSVVVAANVTSHILTLYCRNLTFENGILTAMSNVTTSTFPLN